MIVTIGVIARAHGVRGDVVVDVHTDTPGERFADGLVVATDPPHAGPLTIVHARPHSGRLLVRFDEVTDRAAAEQVRGVRLVADIPDDAETGAADEFFDHQLVGLDVVLADGRRIGEVGDVLHGPGQDLLSIRRGTAPDALVPFVSQIVTSVDLDARRVVVDPPDGLFDLGGAT